MGPADTCEISTEAGHMENPRRRPHSEIANELRDLVLSNANRAYALAGEGSSLTEYAIASYGLVSHRARRQQVYGTLLSMPDELFREAAKLLRGDPSLKKHLDALERAASDQNLESLYRELARIIDALSSPPPRFEPVEPPVTLEQAAALAGLSKRQLERYVAKGKLPPPDYPGGDGKAHKWIWVTLRPALEGVCNRRLPERFPAERFIA